MHVYTVVDVVTYIYIHCVSQCHSQSVVFEVPSVN